MSPHPECSRRDVPHSPHRLLVGRTADWCAGRRPDNEHRPSDRRFTARIEALRLAIRSTGSIEWDLVVRPTAEKYEEWIMRDE